MMASAFRASDKSRSELAGFVPVGSPLNIFKSKDSAKLCSEWTAQLTKWLNTKPSVLHSKKKIETKIAEARAEKLRHCTDAAKTEKLKEEALAPTVLAPDPLPTSAGMPADLYSGGGGGGTSPLLIVAGVGAAGLVLVLLLARRRK